MASTFNKTLLLCPEKYSLFRSFSDVLKVVSNEVVGFDVRKKIDKRSFRFDAQMFRFPNKIRTKWEDHFFGKINKLILEEFKRVKPDLVFIYNSEFLLPETCEMMKKDSKLIFFMGDSPFYTPANNYYLTVLSYADLVLAPDSFWLEQLNTLGITKTAFYLNAIESDSYFELEKSKIEDIPETDVMYVGMCYVNSWGYKKALLMDQFTNFNFKLYGNTVWKRWFNYFPELENKFSLSGHIPTEKLNKMFNKTKLIPVDGNPAIINGVHVRALEALGSGALPLMEYRKDIDTLIFKEFGKDLPLIRNYSKASEVASYYLKNDTERKDLAAAMKDFISKKYSVQNNAAIITDLLNKK